MDKNSISRYRKINGGRTNTKPSKISAHIPKPTEEDYRIGYILRFFVQKTNDDLSPIYEVTNTEYNYLTSKPLYKGVILKWRISGSKSTKYDVDGNMIEKSVSESNRIAIDLEKRKMPNLKLYLPNLLQFHK
jgi:hypothetical protein